MIHFTEQLRREIERNANANANANSTIRSNAAIEMRNARVDVEDVRSARVGVEHVLHKELSYAIIGAAIEVHRVVGPGKLESCYQAALEHELALRGLPFQRQVPIAMQYKGAEIGGFFADLIVDEKIVLELKASRDVRRTHRPQLLSYLHWTGLRLGLLINFDVPVLVHGVRRVVL